MLEEYLENLVSSTRELQETLIAHNPSTITIARTTKVKNSNGGLTATTANLTPITVRIFSQEEETAERTESGNYSRRGLKMFASYDADINKKTELNEDVFVLNSKSYMIIDVMDFRIKDSIVYKIATLEEL